MSRMPNRKMKFKLNVVILGFLTFCFLILSIRIIYIACFAEIDGVKYGDKARNRQMSSVTIRPNRGTIYDRNMTPFAQSATVWTVTISPNQIKSETQKNKVAKELCKILEIEEEDKKNIYKRFNSKRKYEIIKKNVEKPKCDEILRYIKNNKLHGIVNTEEDTKRYYPLGALASHTIGFVGADNQGLLGLELYYDKILSGTPGKTLRVQDALGGPMPYEYETTNPAVDGKSIVISIDSVAQRVCSEALIDMYKWNRPRERCAIIIMDVTDGSIVALAVHPEFDPNEPFETPNSDLFPAIAPLPKKEARERNWKNKVIAENYEPGSTLKVLTASAALDEKTESLKSTFSCSGAIHVGGRRMGCWKSGGHGTQNFTQACVNSCNPAFVTIGLNLGPKRFFKYLDLFGITKKTGIDLPGETEPIYHKEKNLTDVSLASEAFGQSLSITPLQLLNVFSTVVNGGYFYKPHLLKKILDSKKRVIKTIKSFPIRQVISKETSDTMRKVLTEVVRGHDGNGSNASVLGYNIAGKTGTGQKLEKKRITGEESYVGSFVGVLTADRPKYAALVICDEATGAYYYGNSTSSPTFSKVMTKLAPYFGFSAQHTNEEIEKFLSKLPPVEGTSCEEAKKELEKNGFSKIKIIGNEENVITQRPTATTHIDKNSTIYLYTDSDPDEEDKEKYITKVPDISGLSQAQAKEILNNCNLNMGIENIEVRPNPKAFVIDQTPKPGETAIKGDIVQVTFLIDDHTG